jgi:hypothetical protein
VVVGISSMLQHKSSSVLCQCSTISVQIYVGDDFASGRGRGFVARLQISIKFKLSQFGGRMKAGSAHGTASHRMNGSAGEVQRSFPARPGQTMRAPQSRLREQPELPSRGGPKKRH